jgi:ATP-binding cassette subfamily C protein CydD
MSDATPTIDSSVPARRAHEKAIIAWLSGQSGAARRPLRLSIAAGICNGLALIAQAFVLASVLSAVIVHGATLHSVADWVLILVAIYILRAACVYGAERLGFEAAAIVRANVRERVVSAMTGRGIDFSRSHPSGAWANIAIERVDALEGYVARYLPQRILVLCLPLAMIAAAALVNWVVAVIFAITGPLIPLFMILIGKGAAAASQRQFQVMTHMGGYFLDRLRGLTTLKLFGQADNEANKISEVSDGFRIRTMSVLRIAFLSSAVLEFFGAVAVALVALYVGFGLLGYITFGPAGSSTLFAGLFVLFLAPEFFVPLRTLAAHYHDRAAAIGASETLHAVLESGEASQPSELRFDVAPSSAEPPAVSFRSVSLRADAGRPILDRLDLRVRAGERIALVGPSGSGKTTILNLIMGFAEPTTGTIEVGRFDLCGSDHIRAIDHVRAMTAWTGQRPHLFHGTMGENIRLANPAADYDAVLRAAKSARVTDFADRLPDRLDTMVGERGYGLSGGEIQRVALARAFVRDSPLVLLDEPTANLDSETVALILEALERLFVGRTVVVATHDPRVIAHTDRAIHLAAGRIAEDPHGSAAS